jgi:hypothetical protein
MIYNKKTVQKCNESNLKAAKEQLKKIPVYCGHEPEFSGLTGWVFEQTIQHCIRQELDKMNLTAEIEEQVKLIGRAKIDLRIGNTAIEIKTSGLFSKEDIAKYKKYQGEAKERGWRYIFLSIGETTFRTGILEAMGKDNVVLLENYDGKWAPNDGEGARFIGIIVNGLKPQNA